MNKNYTSPRNRKRDWKFYTENPQGHLESKILKSANECERDTYRMELETQGYGIFHIARIIRA